ncbi:50S ribosomal protein L6 [Methylogaea oryzae]|uniref:Large ribosomal subunit protein uL6 n=1 Tax=Methylogaea oryzae TaxID=1295382 RepID=A0A8D4VNH4_9GAMM|nr:50S ribosomal protein L6 [Methylogaea oryzae]BBL69792.1 50S ribosomal protein L6 [Methylogaea oryzae]
MSRVAKNPVVLPKGVEVSFTSGQLTVKGPKGTLSQAVNSSVEIIVDAGVAKVALPSDGSSTQQAGTARAILANMVKGVSEGFERKLTMVGVGYRAQAKGSTVSLSLGYSHPIEFEAPAGITVETPSQTEILVKGCDRQVVGQVAANIRAFRGPEPYKGKGIRYSDEIIVRKEAKKK